MLVGEGVPTILPRIREESPPEMFRKEHKSCSRWRSTSSSLRKFEHGVRASFGN